MSSLRNAIQRRNHRERAQPVERQKWGLLEKKKDYKLRAQDHKNKQRTLRALQVKARDRNEDEFYFAMTSSQTRNGVKITKRGTQNGGGQQFSADTIRLMKTQDAVYLRTVLQQSKKQREKLESEITIDEVGVSMTPAANGSRRIVFSDDGKKIVTPGPGQSSAGDGFMEFESASEVDDVEERLNPADLPKAKALASKQRKLEALRERERELDLALRAVEDQRAKSNGTMGGYSKSGVRFKVRRKR